MCSNPIQSLDLVEKLVASWVVHSSPERAVRVRVLAGDTVFSVNSHSTSLYPEVPDGELLGKLTTANWGWAGGKGELARTGLAWSRNAPSRFMLQKPG